VWRFGRIHRHVLVGANRFANFFVQFLNDDGTVFQPNDESEWSFRNTTYVKEWLFCERTPAPVQAAGPNDGASADPPPQRADDQVEAPPPPPVSAVVDDPDADIDDKVDDANVSTSTRRRTSAVTPAPRAFQFFDCTFNGVGVAYASTISQDIAQTSEKRSAPTSDSTRKRSRPAQE